MTRLLLWGATLLLIIAENFALSQGAEKNISDLVDPTAHSNGTRTNATDVPPSVETNPNLQRVQTERTEPGQAADQSGKKTQSENDSAEPSTKLGIGIPTSGGLQLYADELYFRSWRIQENVLLHQFRLVNGNYYQYAFGSFEKCKQKLDTIREQQKLQPMSGRAVIILHGLASNRLTVKTLEDELQASNHYDEVINTTYPTTRRSIEEHAAWLDRLVSTLDGIEHIDLVGHSLGGIVIRAWLSGLGNPEGKKPDLTRIGRVVMIGSPNQGAFAAEYHYKNNILARTLMGDSLRELGPDWKTFARKLEPLPCPFGLIAGSLGPGKGMCQGTLGENDWVVTVDSVRLPGADDWRVLPFEHVQLPLEKETARMVDSFFMNGYFTTREQQSPLRK